MSGRWKFIARLYQINTTEKVFFQYRSVFIHLYQNSNIFNDCNVGSMWLNINNNIFRTKMIDFEPKYMKLNISDFEIYRAHFVPKFML